MAYASTYWRPSVPRDHSRSLLYLCLFRAFCGPCRPRKLAKLEALAAAEPDAQFRETFLIDADTVGCGRIVRFRPAAFRTGVYSYFFTGRWLSSFVFVAFLFYMRCVHTWLGMRGRPAVLAPFALHVGSI